MPLQPPRLHQALGLYAWALRNLKTLPPDARTYYVSMLRGEMRSWASCTDPHTLSKLFEGAPAKLSYVLRRHGGAGGKPPQGEPPAPPSEEDVDAFRAALAAYRRAVAAEAQG